MKLSMNEEKPFASYHLSIAGFGHIAKATIQRIPDIVPNPAIFETLMNRGTTVLALGDDTDFVHPKYRYSIPVLTPFSSRVVYINRNCLENVKLISREGAFSIADNWVEDMRNKEDL